MGNTDCEFIPATVEFWQMLQLIENCYETAIYVYKMLHYFIPDIFISPVRTTNWRPADLEDISSFKQNAAAESTATADKLELAVDFSL
jgi:hypothetical protein